MSSVTLERTIIQASVLLITLLFVVAKLGSTPEVTGAWFAYIAAILLVPVIVATAIMFDKADGKSADSTTTKYLRFLEFASFTIGLVILFLVFFFWSLDIPGNKYAVLSVCATVLGLTVLYIVVELVRKRQASKGPDATTWLVTRIYYDRWDQTTTERMNKAILSFIKPNMKL